MQMPSEQINKDCMTLISAYKSYTSANTASVPIITFKISNEIIDEIVKPANSYSDQFDSTELYQAFIQWIREIAKNPYKSALEYYLKALNSATESQKYMPLKARITFAFRNYINNQQTEAMIWLQQFENSAHINPVVRQDILAAMCKLRDQKLEIAEEQPLATKSLEDSVAEVNMHLGRISSDLSQIQNSMDIAPLFLAYIDNIERFAASILWLLKNTATNNKEQLIIDSGLLHDFAKYHYFDGGVEKVQKLDAILAKFADDTSVLRDQAQHKSAFLIKKLHDLTPEQIAAHVEATVEYVIRIQLTNGVVFKSTDELTNNHPQGIIIKNLQYQQLDALHKVFKDKFLMMAITDACNDAHHFDELGNSALKFFINSELLNAQDLSKVIYELAQYVNAANTLQYVATNISPEKIISLLQLPDVNLFYLLQYKPDILAKHPELNAKSAAYINAVMIPGGEALDKVGALAALYEASYDVIAYKHILDLVLENLIIDTNIIFYTLIRHISAEERTILETADDNIQNQITMNIAKLKTPLDRSQLHIIEELHRLREQNMLLSQIHDDISINYSDYVEFSKCILREARCLSTADIEFYINDVCGDNGISLSRDLLFNIICWKLISKEVVLQCINILDQLYQKNPALIGDWRQYIHSNNRTMETNIIRKLAYCDYKSLANNFNSENNEPNDSELKYILFMAKEFNENVFLKKLFKCINSEGEIIEDKLEFAIRCLDIALNQQPNAPIDGINIVLDGEIQCADFIMFFCKKNKTLFSAAALSLLHFNANTTDHIIIALLQSAMYKENNERNIGILVNLCNTRSISATNPYDICKIIQEANAAKNFNALFILMSLDFKQVTIAPYVQNIITKAHLACIMHKLSAALTWGKVADIATYAAHPIIATNTDQTISLIREAILKLINFNDLDIALNLIKQYSQDCYIKAPNAVITYKIISAILYSVLDKSQLLDELLRILNTSKLSERYSIELWQFIKDLDKDRGNSQVAAKILLTLEIVPPATLDGHDTWMIKLRNNKIIENLEHAQRAKDWVSIERYIDRALTDCKTEENIRSLRLIIHNIIMQALLDQKLTFILDLLNKHQALFDEVLRKNQECLNAMLEYPGNIPNQLILHLLQLTWQDQNINAWGRLIREKAPHEMKIECLSRAIVHKNRTQIDQILGTHNNGQHGGLGIFNNAAYLTQVRHRIKTLLDEMEMIKPNDSHYQLKNDKIIALSKLLDYTNNMTISAALNRIQREHAALYKQAIKGFFSRTAKLFKALQAEEASNVQKNLAN